MTEAVVQIPDHAASDDDARAVTALVGAIRIANGLLATKVAALTIQELANGDLSRLQLRLESLSIRFATHPKGRKPYGWTEREDDASEINISDVCRDRIKIVSNVDSDEHHRVVFLMAAIIIHELAHLIFRWRKLDKTPEKYGDAGDWLEIKKSSELV